MKIILFLKSCKYSTTVNLKFLNSFVKFLDLQQSILQNAT